MPTITQSDRNKVLLLHQQGDFQRNPDIAQHSVQCVPKVEKTRQAEIEVVGLKNKTPTANEQDLKVKFLRNRKKKTALSFSVIDWLPQRLGLNFSMTETQNTSVPVN